MASLKNTLVGLDITVFVLVLQGMWRFFDSPSVSPWLTGKIGVIISIIKQSTCQAILQLFVP